VLLDVFAQPLPRLVQAGPGGAGRLGDLAGGQVGVVVQRDRAALPGREPGDRGADHVGAVQVVGRGEAAGRDRVQRLGPLAQQGQRGAPGHRAADVGHDAGQPPGEPVRVAQPVQ
jgi:hypothetical protein